MLKNVTISKVGQVTSIVWGLSWVTLNHLEVYLQVFFPLLTPPNPPGNTTSLNQLLRVSCIISKSSSRSGFPKKLGQSVGSNGGDRATSQNKAPNLQGCEEVFYHSNVFLHP